MTDIETTVTVRYNGQPAWGDTYRGRYVIALGETAEMPESHARKLVADFGKAFTILEGDAEELKEKDDEADEKETEKPRAIDSPPRDRMKRKSANRRGGRR